MRIGLIGCGRVGVTLCDILRQNNTLVGVHDKSQERERAAARRLKIRHNPSYPELIRQSEALFIATPDDEIVRAYGKMRRFICGPKYVFHFSALLPADTIPGTPDVHRASVHPFATFSGFAAPSRTERYHLSLEGDAPALKAARAIFGGRHFTLKRIRREDKALYHLVGVFASNLLVGLVAAAGRLAARIGWQDRDLRQLLYPIVEQTIRNIREHGPEEALTGPLRRGDVKTVEKHLRALRRDKDLLNVYKTLSRSLIEYARGADQRKLKRILR